MQNLFLAFLILGCAALVGIGVTAAYSSTNAVLAQQVQPTSTQASAESVKQPGVMPTQVAIPDKPIDLSLWDGARQITITFDEDGQTQITGLVCKDKHWGKVNILTTRDVWRHAVGQQVENEITARWQPKATTLTAKR
jgi:hypothetical protein